MADLSEGLQIRTGYRAWSAEQKTLKITHPQIPQNLQFFHLFDPLSHDAAVEPRGQLHDRPDTFTFDGILMDITHKMPIDLHVVRLNLGPEFEPGIAGPQIINCHLETGLLQPGQGAFEFFHVECGITLRQLNHNLSRRNGAAFQQRLQKPVLVGARQKIVRAHIDEQFLGPACRGPTGASGAQTEVFQLQRPATAFRGFKQYRGGMQGAVRRPSTQGFIAFHPGFPGIHDRLEQCMNTTLYQQILQFLFKLLKAHNLLHYGLAGFSRVFRNPERCNQAAHTP